DAPPPGEIPATLPEPVEPGPVDCTDTKRADAATRKDQSYDGKKAFLAVVDRILGQGPISLRADRSRPAATTRTGGWSGGECVGERVGGRSAAVVVRRAGAREHQRELGIAPLSRVPLHAAAAPGRDHDRVAVEVPADAAGLAVVLHERPVGAGKPRRPRGPVQ